MSDFWEQYKHPLWQKKRMEILERAGWQCEWCDDSDSQLQVHHGYYEKDASPWEYPDRSLFCLCGTCHEQFQEMTRDVKRVFGTMSLADQKYTYGLMRFLQAFARHLAAANSGQSTDKITVNIDGHETASSIAGLIGYRNSAELFQGPEPRGYVAMDYLIGRWKEYWSNRNTAMRESVDAEYVIYA